MRPDQPDSYDRFQYRIGYRCTRHRRTGEIRMRAPEMTSALPFPVADLPSSPQPTTGRGLGLVRKPRRGSASLSATSWT